jgi:uncharacterized protein (DUF1800 family)
MYRMVGASEQGRRMTPTQHHTPAEQALADAPGDLALTPADEASATKWLQRAAALTPILLAACGGGSDNTVDPQTGLTVAANLPGAGGAQPAKVEGLSTIDATRFLTQATFGLRSLDEVTALQVEGLQAWLWRQFNASCVVHTSYLDLQRNRDGDKEASEELSYEAVWRQWLFEDGQLRARVAFALSEIFVISNIAPDIRPYAMSSYMDTLNRHAFGNYRELLKAVTLHPAMGYYLNMLQSQREDTGNGVRPNENYAREVLQLFSIGLVKLNANGSTQMDAQGKAIPTYGEAEVKGFARAFTGWSFGGEGNANPNLFWDAKYDDDKNWVTPMLAFKDEHEPGTKRLLDGKVLPAGQTPEKDMNDALDNIFQHPNVAPFICRQLIQRLVTSNPSGAYIARVGDVFNNNGQGVRGDLGAVVRAILLDAEARGDDAPRRSNYGKQREPVIRLANVLRAFNASTPSPLGRTELHYLDSPEDGLGQSPLLAPSVFNFFSPNYRPAGGLAQAGLVAPEFQITTETSIVSCFNTFASVLAEEGYGWGDQSRLSLNFTPWLALAKQPEQLVDRMNLLLCNQQMSTVTRNRLITLVKALPAKEWNIKDRIKQAFIVLAVSPDFVIQK